MPFEQRMLKCRRRLLGRLLAAALCMLGTGHAMAEAPSREYRIKAAFLYNLTKFITWPNEKHWADDAPIAVCVYGFNPFDTYIEKLQQRTAKGHPIVLRYPGQPNELAGCQILFISQYNTHKPDLLKIAGTAPTLLTVGDDPDFIARNGLIGLIAVGNNVQLNIHLTRARLAGFTVSADLLEIAHKVE